MIDKEKLEEIEAYYKEVGNVVESEWIWLIETLKKYMDTCQILRNMLPPSDETLKPEEEGKRLAQDIMNKYRE